jgi:hypothetical protein
MLICMLDIAAKQIPFINEKVGDFALIFWAESVAFFAFFALFVLFAA